MSRVARTPVVIPTGVDVTIKGQEVNVKGPKGTLDLTVNGGVKVKAEENEADKAKVLTFQARTGSKNDNANAGTARALINNMVTGVSQGFSKQLNLVGVGYRAQAQGNALNLNLGFSHPVNYPLPSDVTVEMPNNTTIVLSSINKQSLGQVAAEIRAIRPPEPYKGKGVRYADEVVVRKETKKK